MNVCTDVMSICADIIYIWMYLCPCLHVTASLHPLLIIYVRHASLCNGVMLSDDTASLTADACH